MCNIQDWLKPDEIVEISKGTLTKATVLVDIRQRDMNGLAKSGAIAKIGTRLRLHREKYPEWKIKRGIERSAIMKHQNSQGSSTKGDADEKAAA